MFISGTVKVWDPRQKDVPVANMEPMEGETKRDCWTVAFGMLKISNFQMITMARVRVRTATSPVVVFSVTNNHYKAPLYKKHTHKKTCIFVHT